MPKVPGIHWTQPEGGLFLWVTLPEGIDTEEMFAEAVERNVAYVVGKAFCADGGGENSMRLNLSKGQRKFIPTPLSTSSSSSDSFMEYVPRSSPN